MPLKLVEPDAARSPYYRVRGTYLGVYVDRSTKTAERAVAKRLLDAWKLEIERGAYAKPSDPTFASALIEYMNAGRDTRFLEPLLRHFGDRPLTQIDQRALDQAAAALYPNAAPATRNRQVYSPAIAILRHAGIKQEFRRPKGARGSSRLHWLKPEEADRLLRGAAETHERFGALCTFLLYTGCRLSEALSLRTTDLHLSEAFAFIRQTKNGDPRPVHLPMAVVTALANLKLDNTRTVFQLSKAGRLYTLLDKSAKKAGVNIPDRVAFHLFRHTYGAWCRRYGKLDTSGLVATGAWKSRQAAAVYEHADVSEAARTADSFPTRMKR